MLDLTWLLCTGVFRPGNACKHAQGARDVLRSLSATYQTYHNRVLYFHI